MKRAMQGSLGNGDFLSIVVCMLTLPDSCFLTLSCAGGVLPIVRLLRPIANCSEAVLLRAVQAIGTLCIGPATCPNAEIQDAVAKANGVDLLANLALKAEFSSLLKAKSMWALSCVTLASKEVRRRGGKRT